MFVDGTEEPEEVLEESEEQSEETPEDDSEQGSEGSEESDESEGEEEPANGTLFFDPKDLKTDEERARWKSMNTAFTRGMQGISAVRKQAAAFEALMADKQFRAWMANGAQEEPQGEEEDSPGDNGDAVAATVRKIMREEIKPLKAELDRVRAQEQDQARQAHVSSEMKELATTYPMWENYRTQMSDWIDSHPNANYSLVEVFKIVSHEDAVKLGGKKAVNALSTKKRANISKPGTKPGEAPPKAAKTVYEAFLQTKRKMQKEGTWKDF